MKHIKKYNESDEIHYDQSALESLYTKPEILSIYQEILDSFENLSIIAHDHVITNRNRSWEKEYLDEDFLRHEISYLSKGRYMYEFELDFRLRFEQNKTSNLEQIGELNKQVSFCSERIVDYKVIFDMELQSTGQEFKLSLNFKHNFNIG